MGYLIRMRRLLGDKERTKHECGYVVVGIGGGHSVMCSYERGAPLFHLLLSALTLPRPVRMSGRSPAVPLRRFLQITAADSPPNEVLVSTSTVHGRRPAPHTSSAHATPRSRKTAQTYLIHLGSGRYCAEVLFYRANLTFCLERTVPVSTVRTRTPESKNMRPTGQMTTGQRLVSR